MILLPLWSLLSFLSSSAEEVFCYLCNMCVGMCCFFLSFRGPVSANGLVCCWFVLYSRVCNNSVLHEQINGVVLFSLFVLNVRLCFLQWFPCWLCVLILVFPESLVVLPSPLFFIISNLALSLSSPLFIPIFFLSLFLSLSLMKTYSHLHPPSQAVPPPHSRLVFYLCPLHGFVLLPQCQRPGKEVTHHRRAAGLTEPQPSPLPSSAENVKTRTVTSSSLLRLCLSFDNITLTSVNPWDTRRRTTISFVRNPCQPGFIFACQCE